MTMQEELFVFVTKSAVEAWGLPLLILVVWWWSRRPPQLSRIAVLKEVQP
jgi:hypothetical protein